jgi:septum formation protein
MNKSFQASPLILASQSPRRKELLAQTGLSFAVIPGRVDEILLPRSDPADAVRHLAEEKARSVSGRHPESWIIGADTIVVIDRMVLGKPKSGDDARSMLRSLSGRTHLVLTGYAVCCRSKGRCFSETVETAVLFKKLADDEIDWYVGTREPFDKAGAYAIQGMGAFMVKSIRGSYTNVVGLPVCEVVEALRRETGDIGLRVGSQI